MSFVNPAPSKLPSTLKVASKTNSFGATTCTPTNLDGAAEINPNVAKKIANTIKNLMKSPSNPLMARLFLILIVPAN
jgi:hypothetical protein